jgi:hypothetical protein
VVQVSQLERRQPFLDVYTRRKDGDRLVYLRHSVSGPGGENVLFSVPEITDFRTSAKTLRGIAEYSGMIYTLQGESDAVRINVGLVTGNFPDHGALPGARPPAQRG